jgi:thiosulfate dehydrogenase (quinone) large subunit
MKTQKMAFAGLRLVMALMFLWAFFDKAFGLGFATVRSAAWINGGSPTYGFLTFAAKGPFAEAFKSLAGLAIIDWLFMLGLLFVGLTLLLNRFVLWGALAGGIMVALMWLAVLPPENNPIIDEHIVYLIVFWVLALEQKGRNGLK